MEIEYYVNNAKRLLKIQLHDTSFIFWCHETFLKQYVFSLEIHKKLFAKYTLECIKYTRSERTSFQEKYDFPSKL
jgi:hypothetical protein